MSPTAQASQPPHRTNRRLRPAIPRFVRKTSLIYNLAILARKDIVIIPVLSVFTEKKNIFTKRSKIEQIWQQMLSRASESVEIFANDDVSWIQRDKEKIQKITNTGIRVDVLCHSPYQNVEAQTHIRALLETGASVKFFDNVKYNPPYGLLIDGGNLAQGTALEVEREFRLNAEKSRGTKTYNYKAIYYTPKNDWRHIRILSALFKSMWEQARDGVVLVPLEIEPLIKNELPQILHLVSQYVNITYADISTEIIDIRDMFSSTTYIKEPSFRSITPICYAFKDQEIPEYKLCYCITHKKHFLLLPPILEVHDDKLVLVDGTHRLFHLYAKQQRTSAFCIILNNAPNLPGKPLPFKDVKMWPRKLPREQAFIGYDHSLYRSFRIMEEKLASNAFSDRSLSGFE